MQDRERLERWPGEEIKDAYTRLRGKLPDGKQLENVILGLPGAGAATHGAAPQPSAGNGATPGAAPPPGAGPGGTGSAPPTSGNLGGTTSPPHGSGTPQPGFAEGPAGNLFGNGGAGIFGGSGTASPKPRIRLEAPKPTSGLNLAGQLEMWSITPATPIQSVTITLEAATGAQLKKLLEKLPDGMIYGLALDREDGPA